VRTISPEYDTVATIDSAGNRVPDGGTSPDVLFLGDSFTFGLGVSDRQTFAWIYCSKLGVTCANLGRPGTGTIRQIETLKYYLNRGWRPHEVKLFAFMMTSYLGGGNDLTDNLREAASSGRPNSQLADSSNRSIGQSPNPSNPSMVEDLFAYRNRLLAISNLMRVIYLVDGPFLRSELSRFAPPRQLARALEITSQQFAYLAQLSQQYRFICEIYVIEPMEDVANETYPRTARAIATIAHGLPVIDLGPVLRNDPEHYYYRFDGHFTPAGHQAVGQFLVQENRDSRLK
jgi:hypothetical protein